MIKNAMTVALALAGLVTAGASSAATLALNPATSTPAPGGTVSGVQLVASNTTGTRGWNLTLQLPTGLTATGVTPNATVLGAFGSCTYDGGTNRIIALAGNLNTDLASGTACTFNFVVGGGVANATVLAVEQTATPGCTVTSGGGTCSSSVTDADAGSDPGAAGVVEAHIATVTTAPVPRTLSYNPAAGSTITFAGGGNVGVAAPNQTIAVTATGTSGTPTLSGCAISGTGAAAFTRNPASLSFPSSNTQNITVGCTYQAAAASATLTCSETDADSAAVSRAWSLSCPAGAVPTVDPTVTSSPATGATLTVNSGLVGSQGLSLIDFSAAGGSGAGSTTINCTSTGAVTLGLGAGSTPAGTTANQTVNGAAAPQDVRVGVNLTSAGQTPAGTVTCVVDPASSAPTNLTFTVNAPAGITFIAPAIIPASSLWSQLSLIALFAALGGLVVALRRNA